MEESFAADDSTLAAQAREGDHAAFYELVRRHRARACGIARSLMRDDHLAEDIVQEALIRAFLHLGTLADTGRFLPWFHQIVRTQARMKLRRGGLYRRELPLTVLAARFSRDDPGYWSQVDGRLFHTEERFAEPFRAADEPSAELMRKEMLAAIVGLLDCLNRKERDIFEAHFFRELSPKEIAECFRTSPAYIYNSLSKARNKVRNERLRVYVRDYVAQRRIEGLPVRRMLDASIIRFH